jgi:hypothetical protein
LGEQHHKELYGNRNVYVQQQTKTPAVEPSCFEVQVLDSKDISKNE